MGTLIALIVLAAVVLFILDSLRAREIATAVAKEYCRRRGLQFLDGTVGLNTLSVCRRGRHLYVRRSYAFDYADRPGDRQMGVIVLLGQDVEHFVCIHE